MDNKNRFDELWEQNPVGKWVLILAMVITALIVAVLLGGAFDQWVYHMVQ
jgi:uncharacterized membrane protein YjjP (DUF1212 family)